MTAPVPPALGPDGRPIGDWLATREVAAVRNAGKRATRRWLKRGDVQYRGALLFQADSKKSIWVYRPLLATLDPRFGKRVDTQSNAAMMAAISVLGGAIKDLVEKFDMVDEKVEKSLRALDEIVTSIAA